MSLFTIGYEDASIADFVAVLKHAGITSLLDVRDFPSSRKAGFSKSPLRLQLESAGINYTHLKVLGDPKEGRLAARRGEMNTFRRVFTDHISNDIAFKFIHQIATLPSDQNTCIMCYERDHRVCHRGIICEEILKIRRQSISHLGVPMNFSKRAA